MIPKRLPRKTYYLAIDTSGIPHHFIIDLHGCYEVPADSILVTAPHRAGGNGWDRRLVAGRAAEDLFLKNQAKRKPE